MYLEKLQVRNVRAIKQADLRLSSRVNVFTGINGSGKTSLLEAIYLLGVGRSFRSNQIKSVINDQVKDLSVFGKLSEPASDSLGISRDRQGKFKVRINNQDQNKLSSLAHYLPVLVITPDSYKLLTSCPQYRRQFLDLSVFHVEHGFSSVWQRYNKVLKQRNAQLKRASSYKDIAIWDKDFALLAETLNTQRNREFFHLKSHLEDIQGIFLPQYRVQYRYYSGWDLTSNKAFSEQLKLSFEMDKRYGYSTLGAHKADIKLTIDSLPVQDVLSRGEQKMLVNAMHLAQAKRLSEDMRKFCLLLVDDLPSELDINKQRILLNELFSFSKVQLFITAISTIDTSLHELDKKEVVTSMFHVEQGSVSQL